MKFALKSYQDKEYIEYSDNEQTFTNAEYFIFSATSEEYHNIVDRTGGFVANMTRRYIEEHQLDAAAIMLCCIPQK